MFFLDNLNTNPTGTWTFSKTDKKTVTKINKRPG